MHRSGPATCRRIDFHDERDCTQMEDKSYMRALIIEAPNSYQIGEVATPAAEDSAVVIDVVAGGICGTDLEILHGDMFYYTSGMARFPVIPCHEWTGIVRSVGRDVSHVSVGDNVVGEVSIGCLSCRTCLSGHYHRCAERTETGVMNRQGGFAEQIALPATFVHPISASVPLRSAALVEPSSVAYNGIRRAGVCPDDKVAIFGDGPIGLLLLQIARAFGAQRIVLIGAADRRLALAKTLGADVVLDARQDNLEAAVREAFDGDLPSVVFEASGNPEAIRSAVAVTAPGGRIVLQGFCGGKRVDGFNVDPIIVNDMTVMGALASPGIWPQVIRLIESKRIDPSLIVTDELPVSQFGEAVRRVESREAVKVVLRTDRDSDWN